MHLTLIKIPVSDIEKSVQFYEQYLNIKNIFYVKEYGWAQYDLDGIPLALYQIQLGGGSRTLGGSLDFHFALDFEEFDELAHKLLKANILKENRIHKGNDGSTFIELLDPDNNELKIFRLKK